jgi:hypothetical protein
MSRVIEIEKAIRELPAKDLAELRRWFAEFDADQWDRQIERDAATGRLDRLAEEAIEDVRKGEATEL